MRNQIFKKSGLQTIIKRDPIQTLTANSTAATVEQSNNTAAQSADEEEELTRAPEAAAKTPAEPMDAQQSQDEVADPIQTLKTDNTATAVEQPGSTAAATRQRWRCARTRAG